MGGCKVNFLHFIFSSPACPVRAETQTTFYPVGNEQCCSGLKYRSYNRLLLILRMHEVIPPLPRYNLHVVIHLRKDNYVIIPAQIPYSNSSGTCMSSNMTTQYSKPMSWCSGVILNNQDCNAINVGDISGYQGGD
jgi:hypothetical protein